MAAGRGRPMIAVLLVLGLLHSAAATTYPVGASGSNGGWTLQPTDDSFYDDEFKNITLFVNDALYFSFSDGAHNVYEVTQEKLMNCDGTSAISTYTSSSTIPLTSAGYHGFICTIPTHCSQYGMHLSVTVLPPPGSPPTPAPSLGGPPGPAPIPSPSSPPLRGSPGPAPISPIVSTPVPSPTPLSGGPPLPAPSSSPTPSGAPSSNAQNGPSPAPSFPTTGSPPSPPAPSPVAEGPTTPKTPTSPPPSPGVASTIRSGPATIVAVVLACCAAMFL